MTIDEKYPLALTAGSVLAGRYIVEKVLGQGGFGITYKATDHKTGEKVAVKEFFPDSLAYREGATIISYPGDRTENFEYGKQSFLQEAQTLAQFIGNTNIVKIHCYFEENSTAYFVMDYIEGTSFDEYIKQKGGKISVEEAKNILIPIMDALDVVHSKGIIHRDVTPDNIYICNDGTVKLLDFGAARYSLGDKSRSLDVILKHGFAPKEQYTRHGKQGPYTDIYSLAATFYFAITGRRPPDSVDRLDEDDLIPPSSLGIDITDYQEKALYTALEVQPQDRFKTMSVFKKVLLNENITEPSLNAAPEISLQTADTPIGKTQVGDHEPQTDASYKKTEISAASKRSKKYIGIGAAVIVGIAITAGIVGFIMSGNRLSADDSDKRKETLSTEAIAADNKQSEKDEAVTTSAKPVVTTSQQPAVTTTQQPAATSETDPETKKGSTAMSDLVCNVDNGGIYIYEDEVSYYVTDYGKSLYYYYNGQTYLIGSDESNQYSNLISADNVIYFINNKKVYIYSPEKNKVYRLSELESYSNVEKLYVSDDYYFVYDSGQLYRIEKSTGNYEERIQIDCRTYFTILNGNLYYIGKSTNGSQGVFRVPADDFYADGSGYEFKNSTIMFITSDESNIYFSLKQDGSWFIYKTDEKNFNNDSINYYNVTNVIPDVNGYLTEINACGDYIFFLYSSKDLDESVLYSLNILNNNVDEIMNSLPMHPNVVKYSNGGFQLWYWFYDTTNNIFSIAGKDFI